MQAMLKRQKQLIFIENKIYGQIKRVGAMKIQNSCFRTEHISNTDNHDVAKKSCFVILSKRKEYTYMRCVFAIFD